MLDSALIYNELKGELDILDKERLRYYNRVKPFQYALWIVLWILGPFLLLRLNISALKNLFFPDSATTTVLIWWGVAFMVTLLVFAIVHNVNLRKFKKLFAAEMGPKIIDGLGKDFKYNFEGKIEPQVIVESLLFTQFTDYNCQDLVTGSINNVPIKFAEIRMSKTTQSGGKSNSRTIFKGIFFEAELSSSFPTGIWIVGPAQYHTAANSGKEQVDIDHPGFKRYRFYADDLEEAQKVLQPFVLDKIAAVNKKLDKDVRITFGHVGYHFEGSKIQVAIPTRGQFLEPRLSRSMHDVSFIEEQVVLLNALSTLMKDLSLG